MKKILLIITVTFSLLYIGCSKAKDGNEPAPETCNTIDSHFEAKVLPVIQSSCASSSGCHGNGSSNGPGELTSFTQISNAASPIKNAVVSGRMPVGRILGTEEKNAILCWINSGGPDN